MKKIILFLSFLIFIFMLSSCNTIKEKSGMIFAFDTTIEIKIKCANANAIYDEINKIFNDYSDLADRYTKKEINNVYTINHSDDFVLVDQRLIELLNEALQYQKETNGYFNPLIGNISEIYKQIIKDGDVSRLDNLEAELVIMKNSKIIINGNMVKIEGDASIDLGAITKGYALKKVNEYLKEQNITNYLISAGYSSISLGDKDGKEYRVGLKYDDSKILNLKNTTIGSCSMHEQNRIIDNVLYHHIVNPLNGKCENKYSTIYLIGEDPSMIDAYATAFFNMEIQEIKTICENKKIKYLIYQNDVLTYNN